MWPKLSVIALKRLTPGIQAEVSVILRRQVPIRFDETARSWLGGLPQMPRTVAWPRAETNGAALNFIAQICCADLPEQIWGGRGPKDGWLLLFVDAEQLESTDDGDLVRVLYIHKLGPEHRPPGATMLRSILSRLKSTDADNEASATEPPVVYRRWPIDIVVQKVPPQPRAGSDADWAPTPIAGAELYGAPEDDKHIRTMSLPEPRPRTWRSALHMVDQLIGSYKHHASGGQLTAIPPRWGPGWLEKAKAKAAADLAGEVAAAKEMEEWLKENASKRPTEHAKERLADARRWIPIGERHIAELAPYSGPEGEVAFARQIERDAQQHITWVEKVQSMLARMRAEIVAQPIDAHLPETEWARLKAQMAAERTKYWFKPHGEIRLQSYEQTLLAQALMCLSDEPGESVLDAYTRSASARASIPREQLAELEPKLRHISSTPHRMGGPRDVVHNSTEPGDGDLLFQLGSDDAMGWMWADLGALFVYIDPADLKARQFKQIHAWLDGG